ncbi:MAG: MFS transporter [Phascolarctobacterium sp.]|nr:MFS transporter [Phascolarctobacterium sp.]
MKNWKIVLGILTANVVMMAAGYTMLIPFLPMYLIKELGVSMEAVKLWNGAIFSITFLIGGIMAPIWGKLADTKGKKMMAMRAGAGLALSYYLGGVVTSPEQMFCVRVLQGFAAGLWSVCLAIATSLVPLEKLGVSLGVLQAGLTCGNVIGPLLGGSLATLFGMRMSFFVAGSLLTLITIIFYFYIPEPNQLQQGEEQNEQNEQNEQAGARRQSLLTEAAPETEGPLWKQPLIREALLYVAIAQMVILLIQPILTLYVGELTQGEGNLLFLSGMVFSLVGIASALTAPSWGRFGQKHGFYSSLCFASLSAGLMNFFVALPNTLLYFGVANFVYGLCTAGIQPSLSAILASNTNANQRGRVFGFMFSAQQFGSMVGPLVGGAIATFFPLRALFIVAAFILLGISVAVWRKHLGAKSRLA